MPRTAAINKFSAALAAAGASADWDQLGVLSSALGPQLQQWRARAPWSNAELQALAQLRAAHEGAAHACNSALDMLSLRLAELRSNKEGWMAYAIANDAEPAEYTE